MLRAINSAACKYPGLWGIADMGQHGHRDRDWKCNTFSTHVADSHPLPAFLMASWFCASAVSALALSMSLSRDIPSPIPPLLASQVSLSAFLIPFLTWLCQLPLSTKKYRYSYISSGGFFVLFFRSGRNKMKNLELKWSFKVTEFTSPYLRALVDYTVSAEVVMGMLMFVLWRHSTN